MAYRSGHLTKVVLSSSRRVDTRHGLEVGASSLSFEVERSGDVVSAGTRCVHLQVLQGHFSILGGVLLSDVNAAILRALEASLSVLGRVLALHTTSILVALRHQTVLFLVDDSIKRSHIVISTRLDNLELKVGLGNAMASRSFGARRSHRALEVELP